MEEQNTQLMNTVADLSDETEIEIINQASDLWKVRIFFPSLEASDYEMVGRMREAKRMISLRTGLPVESLELRRLLEKRETPQGVIAIVLIGVTQIGRGKPEVILKPIQTPYGHLFGDMIALVNIHYLDEFNHPITADRVLNELKKQGVDLDLCDLPLIRKTVDGIHHQKNSVVGLEIARGEIPAIGVDAELEYTFLTDPESAESLSEYRIQRKVREKDVICQKIPPRDGTKTGFNVRGEKLSPIRGLDFALIAGEGTKLSRDGCSLTALRAGVAILSRKTRRIYTIAGEKIVPDQIEVVVKPIIELNAADIVNLVIEESVEILGDLKSGSVVRSKGEIFLEGNIEDGSNISSRENILVEGKITGSEISADKSVYGEKGIQDSNIAAGENVSIKGKAVNSTIIGSKVRIDEAQGSKIIAGSKVTLNRTSGDSSGRKTTIRIGRKDFYQKKLEMHQNTIRTMKESLKRIRDLFGPGIVNQLDGANYQQLLIQYIKTLRQKGRSTLDNETIQALRELLQSINPLQDVILEKVSEIDSLTEKAQDEAIRKPVVVVREKIQQPIEIAINETIHTLEPSEGGKAITRSEGGKVHVYELKKPSHKSSKKPKPAKQNR